MSAYLPGFTAAALRFEQTFLANGSVFDDTFYTVPSDTANTAPGTLLKIEKNVPTTTYTLPPSTTLSRIIFQSKTLNGSPVPASAYLLWPFSPRKQDDGYLVVAYAHAAKGIDPNWAPSHMTYLLQQFEAPYLLALHGYVVIAPDYAGLGVGKDEAGEPILHEFMASPAQANDVFYAVQAARRAFPQLSTRFTVLGHSEGGGAAWACAQRQAVEPHPGYLGAVAVSPVTKLLDQQEPFRSMLFMTSVPSIAAAFADFQSSDILTATGKKSLQLVLQAGGYVSSNMSLLYAGDLLQPDWTQNPSVQKHQSLVANGGKKIRGPLLVIHGEADPLMSASACTRAVETTAALFPKSQLEHILVPEVTHVPALFASQRVWMDWIADRFAGRAVEAGLRKSVLTSVRP